MYNYDEKSSAIREIQRFLSLISQNDESIPHITVDGYFGDETRLAVIEFQRSNALEQTGVVDRLTFDTLYNAYLKRLLDSELENENFDVTVFPLKVGDSGSDVSTLNKTLYELEAFYKELIRVDGDFFSTDTEYSVKEMQKHLLEDQSGLVDNTFLNRLKKELKIRQKFADSK